MSRILVVTDVPWVRSDVHAALNAPDYDLVDLDAPAVAAGAVAAGDIDATVVDLQVATMGGMAITRAIRDRAELDGRSQPPVVMLLDRSADAFLARRAGASAWLTKPFTAHALRSTLATAIAAKGGAAPAPPLESDEEPATIN